MPRQIAGLIIKKLRSLVAAGAVDVNKVYITMPAYFATNEYQKRATI